ncbi:hypothetical protein Hanom_Chr09g00805261 [Helianthus anomalus]
MTHFKFTFLNPFEVHTCVRFASNFIHSNGKCRVGLQGYGPVTHGTGTEPFHYFTSRFNLFQRHLSHSLFKFQKPTKITSFIQFMNAFRILFIRSNAVTPSSFLQFSNR